MRLSRIFDARAWTLLLAFVFASIAAFGQISTGSLSGTITDPTGSVIPNASVVIVDQVSGTTYTATGSSEGYYLFPSIRPGTYKLTVTAAGFEVTSVTDIPVFIATRASENVKMNIGQASSTVVVNANGPSLDTETSDVGTVLNSRMVEDLPLAVGGAFRSLATLSFLAPGAVGPGTNGGTFQTKINGGQTLGSDYLIDGLSTYRSENGSGNFDQTTPSVESVQEFRIETTSLPAQYGNTTGGIANYKSRSGDNSYHGQVYDFFKNKALDANNWFNNGYLAQIPDTPANAAERTSLQPPPDTKNDYGITLGGPVVIPHLYSGRDKTFFFFNFEQLVYHTGGNSQSTVPTVAQRAGDFSATLGGPTNSINPCTGKPMLAGQLYDPNSPTQSIGGVQCRSVAFVNNQIPTNRSVIAQKVLALVPLPSPNFHGTGTNNYVLGFTQQDANTDYSLRVDQNFGTRNHVFAFGSARENSTGAAPNLPLPLDSGPNITDQFYKYARIGWDFSITPHLVNDLTIGGNRVNSFNAAAASVLGTNYDQQLGIPNTAGATTTFPIFNLGEPQVPTLGNNNLDDNVDNAVIGNEALNWQHGLHSVIFGGTYRIQQFSYINNGPSSGTFNFARDQTGGTSNAGSGTNDITGNGIASFMLGAPGDINRTIQLHYPRWIQHSYAIFAQDDWKVKRNLTFNLGIRWNVETPRYEAEGDSSNFSPTLPNPGAGGLLGALAFAGVGTGRDGNKHQTWASTYYKDFEPRVGFSYSPGWLNDKVVLRGAYTIVSGPLEYADYGQGLTAGFTQGHDHNSFSINQISPLDAGFPASDQYLVNTDPSQRNGQGVDYVIKTDGRPSTIQNWSMESETQIAPDLVFTLGYLGQHSVRLRGYLYEPNNIPQSALQLGDLLGAPVDSPQAVAAGIKVPFAGFQALYGGGDKVGQALAPFPQVAFMSNDNYLQNRGQASYNALEAKLQRNFRNGLNLLVSYTWSKTITDADSIQPFFATLLGQGGTQNPYNLKAEKAVSNQDVPNNFVVSYVYDLPVGRGKAFLSNTPRVVNAVIGGWRVGGIQRYLSGSPVSFFGLASGPPSGFYFGIRPNRVLSQPLLTPVGKSGHYNPFDNTQRVFNNLAFSDPNAESVRHGGAFVFGNEPRVTTEFRTPTSLNEDLNISKSFTIHEKLAVEFRGEMFNAFNRHIFGKPDTGITDSNFGQIGGTLNGPRNVQFVLKVNY